ncbi:Centromere protein X [Takifugu flavidus]|uniref:Centromere protein X n=1 Tax=Takifugu flavidus TaxID=433684 RepID=A0A5C6NR81_9TELE|nr:Centromere protein X [Takifugu flavidus]
MSKDTVSKLLASFFKEDKTRLSGDAATLMAEMLRIFVREAAVRAQKQAEAEDCDQVDIEHFEKILPQLVGATGGGKDSSGTIDVDDKVKDLGMPLKRGKGAREMSN